MTFVLGVGAFEFSVASYNILAQDMIEQHYHLYRHCDDQHLHWSYRQRNIIHKLNKHNPDVSVLFLCIFLYKVRYLIPQNY